MKTLVLANQKGGVGKSAVASLLAHYFFKQGRRVLAIDLDHQGNFSDPLALSKRARMADVTSDVLLTSREPQLPHEAFVFVRAGDGLLGLERQPDMHTPFARNFRAFLKVQDERFDVCVIDTHPTPDIRLISALASTDFVLSPIQLTQESIDGVRALIAHPLVGISKIKALLNPKLEFIGLLPTMVEATPFQRANFVQLVERHLSLLIRIGPNPGDLASIPRRSAIAEAQANGALLWEVKKTAARDAWAEIEPTIRRIADIVVRQGLRMRFDLPTMDEIRGSTVALAAGAPMQLSVVEIDEDPEQPRQEFDHESLVQLAATIAGRGVRQPVSVRRHPEQPGRWMLNFGARRLRAAKLAGESTIAAFEDVTVDSYDQVIENEQREGLKPLEIALFVKRRLDQGESQADIARGLRKSQPYITYACSLVDPPDWLMDLYRSGKCRGMFELHELRRLHASNGAAVDAALAAVEHFGRVELKLLKTHLAGVQQGKRPLSEPGGGGASARSESPVHGGEGPRSELHHLRLRSPGSPLAADASVSRQLEQPGAAGHRASGLPTLGARVVICASHDEARVRVILDELPDAPASVFVVSNEGTRVVARIDALDRFELAIDPTGRL